VFAGDRDRDRAAAALREHYVGGRLTVEELSTRTELVLAARSRADLRAALAGLPLVPDVRDFARHGRAVAAAALGGVALVALTAAYMIFSLVLLLVLALVLVIHGADGSELVGMLLVWLVPTYLLARLWRRGLRRISP
jgi:hypothetical protein